jgi:hypothetical protein
MARFILIAAVVGGPPGHSYAKFPRGTTIADSTGNAVAGKVVWPGLCQAPSPANMARLDAAALALMPTRPNHQSGCGDAIGGWRRWRERMNERIEHEEEQVTK